MYIKEILWLASWPVLIYVSYRLAYFAINKFENNIIKIHGVLYLKDYMTCIIERNTFNKNQGGIGGGIFFGSSQSKSIKSLAFNEYYYALYILFLIDFNVNVFLSG